MTVVTTVVDGQLPPALYAVKALGNCALRRKGAAGPPQGVGVDATAGSVTGL